MSRVIILFLLVTTMPTCGCWQTRSFDEIERYAEYVASSPANLIDFFPKTSEKLSLVRFVAGAHQGENRFQCVSHFDSEQEADFVLSELQKLEAISVKSGFDENDPSTFKNGSREPRILLKKNDPRYPLADETVVTLRENNQGRSGFVFDKQETYVIFWAVWH
jgi:hypothetical protein